MPNFTPSTWDHGSNQWEKWYINDCSMDCEKCQNLIHPWSMDCSYQHQYQWFCSWFFLRVSRIAKNVPAQKLTSPKKDGWWWMPHPQQILAKPFKTSRNSTPSPAFLDAIFFLGGRYMWAHLKMRRRNPTSSGLRSHDHNQKGNFWGAHIVRLTTFELKKARGISAN